jgi:hypothetical protein
MGGGVDNRRWSVSVPARAGWIGGVVVPGGLGLRKCDKWSRTWKRERTRKRCPTVWM